MQFTDPGPEAINPPFPVEDPIERIILRSMNEGVVTLECDGTVHTVNPAALRILGLDASETRGKNFSDVFLTCPENEPFVSIFAQALGARSDADRKETVFKRNDGQIVDLSVTSAFLEVDACEPSLQSVVVVFRDITAFKSLERVKKKAVNHLSHELKTPLAIARASVESLIDKELPRDSAVKRLRRASRNLDRLTSIQDVVEEVLNPPPFVPRRFDPVAFVGEVLDQIREQASFRDVRLVADVDAFDPEGLDPKWIRSILRTFVKNAIENTPDGGWVRVSFKRSDKDILLEVQDSGIGILEQDQPFIFEGFLYTQATEDYSSKRPFEFNAGGKGLELLRAKALSESANFEIGFRSRRCRHIPTDLDLCPGNVSRCPHVRTPEECGEAGGSTFFVRFPIQAKALGAGPQAATE